MKKSIASSNFAYLNFKIDLLGKDVATAELNIDTTTKFVQNMTGQSGYDLKNVTSNENSRIYKAYKVYYLNQVG